MNKLSDNLRWVLLPFWIILWIPIVWILWFILVWFFMHIILTSSEWPTWWTEIIKTWVQAWIIWYISFYIPWWIAPSKKKLTGLICSISVWTIIWVIVWITIFAIVGWYVESTTVTWKISNNIFDKWANFFITLALLVGYIIWVISIYSDSYDQ